MSERPPASPLLDGVHIRNGRVDEGRCYARRLPEPWSPMNDTLERAIALACRVHAGQRDKAGKAYILHPCA